MVRFAILAAVLGVSCNRAKSPAADPCAKTVAKGPIKWIEDDYPAALACAKQKQLPIALDMWAPWCHSCIAMQTTVFMDASFATLATKFVFLGLDTDREENAIAVGKFATSAMPTFYVIGHDESVLARFVGTATLAEFHQFLGAGEQAAHGGMAKADARLLGAERALAARDLETADQELTAALAAAPEAWPRRTEVLYHLQMTKSKRADFKGCAEVSEKYLDMVGQTSIATNFWNTARECATELEKADPTRATALQERAIGKLHALLERPDAPISVDDRGEALGYLRDGLDHIGNKAEAKLVAEKLRVHLDQAMAAAPTPTAKMVFLWPRAEAYAYLGRALDLVAEYEKLAAELPNEYDPPARLGWLYLKAGKLPEATKWNEKALAMVYGPRKSRLLAERAEIAAAAGDKAAERRYREEAVKLWETLPPGQQSPTNLAKAKAALAAVKP